MYTYYIGQLKDNLTPFLKNFIFYFYKDNSIKELNNINLIKKMYIHIYRIFFKLCNSEISFCNIIRRMVVYSH